MLVRCGMTSSVSLIVVFALLGCDSGRTATVSGKVTYSAKEVTGGNLVFSPVGDGKLESGVPVTVPVGSDGTYVASNVVVGKCNLSYLPPPDDYPPGYKPKPSEPPPASPFKGLVAKEGQFEVKAGSSVHDVELVPRAKK